MLRLLKNVRRVYTRWRALPVEDRARYSEEMHRITSLVRELGGARAVRYVEGSAGAMGHDAELDGAPGARPRPEIMAELQEATSSLLAALVSPTREVAMDSVPRTIRIGGKLARKGAQRYLDRHDG